MIDPTTDSWTGGQYSLCRALIGLALAGWCGCTALHAAARAYAGDIGYGPAAVAMTGVLAGLFLAAGAFDRVAAAALFVVEGLLGIAGLPALGPGGLAVAGILVLHVAQPSAPYLSLAAIGRVDPAGDWAPRPWWPAAVWGVLAMAHAAGIGLGAATWTALPVLLALVAAVAALVPRLRGAAFVALVIAHGAGLILGDGGSAAAFLIVLPFAIDPRWFGGAARGAGAGASGAVRHDLVFYDGDCGLCHRAVRFLVAEDRLGARFRYAPLGGGEAERRLGPSVTRDLPDSIVILRSAVHDRPLVRSAAILHALDRLGGLWRAIALAGRLIPRPVGDALYDAVAGVRKRLFAAPRAACPILPPELRARFILDASGPPDPAVPPRVCG